MKLVIIVFRTNAHAINKLPWNPGFEYSLIRLSNLFLSQFIILYVLDVLFHFEHPFI